MQKKRVTKKSSHKKSKEYIPLYKAIILCIAIIAICMTMLLLTTVTSSNSPKKQRTSITQRYTPEKKDSATSKSQSTKPSTNTDNAKPQQKSSVPQQKSSVPQKESSAIKNTQQATQTQKANPQQKNLPSTQSQPQQSLKQPSQPQNPPKSSEPQKTSTPSPQQNSDFNFPQAKNGAQLVFIFDDGGQNLEQLQQFFSLKFPFTVAVLPHLAHSKESANRIRNSGNEVILHQPMQAINKNVNPGPGAITPDMDEGQIISTLFSNINEIGPIAGMNNHEGSLITADAEKMAVIMKFCSEQGIFFLDSRTNAETQVPYVAKELGYSYYERNIFLDNEKSRQNILTELRKGLNIANQNGVAVMIGHVWSSNILPQVLNEVYPELVQKGYTFKTVSNCNGKKR